MRWIVCLFGLVALPSSAATYICVVQGKPVYTTTKIGNLCEISDMNGIGERQTTTFAPPPTVSPDVALPNETRQPVAKTPQETDQLYKLWHELEYGSYDKVPISPITQLPKSTNTTKPTTKTKPKVAKTPVTQPKTNQATTKANTTENKSAAYEYLPSIKRFNRVGIGLMNRRQILLQEIQREQAALAIAREQLTAARKRNDTEAVKKYSLMVLDRQQNVLALSRELRR